jgi:hypothetical protein
VNGLKDKAAVSTDVIYVILGARRQHAKDKGSSRRYLTAVMRRGHALD